MCFSSDSPDDTARAKYCQSFAVLVVAEPRTFILAEMNPAGVHGN
jgi:hypothetical protein